MKLQSVWMISLLFAGLSYQFSFSNHDSLFVSSQNDQQQQQQQEEDSNTGNINSGGDSFHLGDIGFELDIKEYESIIFTKSPTTKQPTPYPTVPTSSPVVTSAAPTTKPTKTKQPSSVAQVTSNPTQPPTPVVSLSKPTKNPKPSRSPTRVPSKQPTVSPSLKPTQQPVTSYPTTSPVVMVQATSKPSGSNANQPTSNSGLGSDGSKKLDDASVNGIIGGVLGSVVVVALVFAAVATITLKRERKQKEQEEMRQREERMHGTGTKAVTTLAVYQPYPPTHMIVQDKSKSGALPVDALSDIYSPWQRKHTTDIVNISAPTLTAASNKTGLAKPEKKKPKPPPPTRPQHEIEKLSSSSTTSSSTTPFQQQQQPQHQQTSVSINSGSHSLDESDRTVFNVDNDDALSQQSSRRTTTISNASKTRSSTIKPPPIPKRFPTQTSSDVEAGTRGTNSTHHSTLSSVAE